MLSDAPMFPLLGLPCLSMPSLCRQLRCKCCDGLSAGADPEVCLIVSNDDEKAPRLTCGYTRGLSHRSAVHEHSAHLYVEFQPMSRHVSGRLPIYNIFTFACSFLSEVSGTNHDLVEFFLKKFAVTCFERSRLNIIEQAALGLKIT